MKNLYTYSLLLSFALLGSVANAAEEMMDSPVMITTTEDGKQTTIRVEITEYMSSGMQPTATYNPATEADDALNASAISE